jgi:hypothetical protein
MKKKLVSCLISFTLLSSLSTPLLAKAQENTGGIKGSGVLKEKSNVKLIRHETSSFFI